MTIWDDTREDWRARPPTSALTIVSPHRRTGRTWHWAGPATNLFGKPHSACLAMVRAWQSFHQRERVWKDIGYNGLICVHARAIEGRGTGPSGAHSPSWNTTRWGIQYMIGTGEEATPAMLARGAALAAALEQLAGHDLTDSCHHDDPKVSTQCCGPQLTAWVRAGGPEHQEEPMPDATEPNYVGTPAAVDVVKALMRSDVFPHPDRANHPDNPYVTGYQWLQIVGGYARDAAGKGTT